jgi:hypothetical protein
VTACEVHVQNAAGPHGGRGTDAGRDGDRPARRRGLVVHPEHRPAVLSATAVCSLAQGQLAEFGVPRLVRVEPPRARAIVRGLSTSGEQRHLRGGARRVGTRSPRSAADVSPGISEVATMVGARCLYFFGYALTHYHALPWSLRRRSRWRPATGRGGALTCGSRHGHNTLRAPDDSLRRRRLIVRTTTSRRSSRLGRGAHLWRDYVEVRAFPSRRTGRVHRAIGRQPLPLIALDARLGTPALTFR